MGGNTNPHFFFLSFALRRTNDRTSQKREVIECLHARFDFVQSYRTMEGSAEKTPTQHPTARRRLRLEQSQAAEAPDEPEELEEEPWSDIEEEVPDEIDPHADYEAGLLGGRKRLRQPMRGWPEEEQELPGNGDLTEFFGDIPPKDQIAICRAYASYLAAQNRARKPGKPATYAPRWRK